MFIHVYLSSLQVVFAQSIKPWVAIIVELLENKVHFM